MGDNMRRGYTVAVYFHSEMEFKQVLAFMRLVPPGTLASGRLGDPLGLVAEQAEIADSFHDGGCCCEGPSQACEVCEYDDHLKRCEECAE